MPHPTPYFEGKAYIKAEFRKVHGRELPKPDLFAAAKQVYAELHGVTFYEVTNEQAGWAIAHCEDEVLDLLL